MKLATLRDGTPDGRLVVVSRDLRRAVDATHIARSLLAALESWDTTEPRLRELAGSLDRGRGVNAFDTSFRSFACRGGSIMMIIGGRAVLPCSSETPADDEYVSQSCIAACTSANRESAQKSSSGLW